MSERGRAEPFDHEQAQPMVRPGGAALSGIQEGEKVLEMDLSQIPWQDSACHTYALEHSPAQSRLAFLAQVDRR